MRVTTLSLQLSRCTTACAACVCCNSRLPAWTGVVGIGTTVGATHELGELSPGTGGIRSSWWSWTAPVTAIYNVTLFGSTFDTLMGVYNDTNGSLAGAKLVRESESLWRQLESDVFAGYWQHSGVGSRHRTGWVRPR